MIQVFQNLLTEPDDTASRSSLADLIIVIVMMAGTKYTEHRQRPRRRSKHFKWARVLNCSSAHTHKVSTIIAFILRIRKLRQKDIKQFAKLLQPAGGRTGIQNQVVQMGVDTSLRFHIGSKQNI